MPFGPEVLIVLGVVVLMFGGSKLPGLARSLGSAKQEFESASKGKADAETGAVKGVKDALNKLAKDKPYLLKGKTGDKKEGGGAGTNGASGHNPAGGGDTADKNKVRQKLASKYKLR